jgi:hypothetical protein
MRSISRAAVMATAIAACGTAFADQGFYVGGALSQVEFKPDGGPTFNPTAIAAVLGKEFSPNLAGEVRLGAGLGADSNVEVDNYVGVYGKGILPVSKEVSIYGLLGLTSTKLKFTGGGGSASDSSFSYGFGADFAINRTTSIGVEWASLVRASGYDVNALSLLAKYKF